MNLLENQEHYNNIKKARDHYKENSNYYANIAELFDILLAKMDEGIDYDKSTLQSNIQFMCLKLKSQDLELRKHFIEVNKFNEYDLEKLSGLLVNEVKFNSPTLELFPGTGQFLPYTIAAEPLYVADRFMEICNIAGDALQNDFYNTRRLRKYKIDYFSLRTLPQNQFGLVYCFNEFFYADNQYIIAWSKLVYNLLYSGGKFIFNFIPDDQPWAIRHNMMAEFSNIDYEGLIKDLKLQGWIIDACQIQQTKASYIIVKKPGDEKPRLKISGSIAEIIDI